MYVVTVIFKTAPADAEKFLAEMTRNARQSLDLEEGCRRFDVCTGTDAPEEVFLYELYSDEAAFKQHLEMPHFKAFSELTAPWVTEKIVRTYNLVD